MAGVMIERNRNSSFEGLKHLLDGQSGGPALVQNIEDNPICAVSYDAAVPCLFVQWRGRAKSAHIRYIHEHLLRLIEKHRVSKILGDDAALVAIPAVDEQWIVSDWMPRAMAAGLKAAASKRPERHTAWASVKRIQTAVPDGLSCRTFETLGEAKKWLRGVYGAGIYRIEYRRFQRGKPIITFAFWCREPTIGHFNELARVALRSFWKANEGSLEPITPRQPLPEVIVVTTDSGEEVHRWSLEDEIRQLDRATQ